MEPKQMVCWSAVILVIVAVIYLIISGIRKSKADKIFLDEMMRRNGWQNIGNPKTDLRDWVLTELEAQPDLYPVFGQVREWHLLSSIHRDQMSIRDLWTKQDGGRTYFILDITDWYYSPGSKGSGKSSRDLTIIGMRAPLSLPFFTLLPKMEFPKKTGWRYSISEAHNLNLSDKINEISFELSASYVDHRVRAPLELPSILGDEAPAPEAIDPPISPKAVDPSITSGSGSFDERFELYGKETERVRHFFDRGKLTALESLPQNFVDAGGGLVFVYIPEHKPKVEDFEKFINDRVAIINAVAREPRSQDNI